MIIALAFGAMILAAMSIGLPFRGLLLLCLLWGLGAGVVMTQGRTIVQIAAPETHRARILSMFQLGLMGGAPVGSLLIGYLAAFTGPRQAAVYPAAVHAGGARRAPHPLAPLAPPRGVSARRSGEAPAVERLRRRRNDAEREIAGERRGRAAASSASAPPRGGTRTSCHHGITASRRASACAEAGRVRAPPGTRSVKAARAAARSGSASAGA